MPSPQTLVLHDADNIAVTMRKISQGESVESFDFVANQNIPSGHKIAVRNIASGEEIIKYGNVIGVASQNISFGDHVHTQNVAMTESQRNNVYTNNVREEDTLPITQRSVFQGYKRADGGVGTRNYVGIVTSVNCNASAAKLLVKEAEKSGILDQFPGVDGIVPIVHGAGCCIGTNDEAFRKLQRAIWGYATHPNFASVLMLGLG